LQRAPTWNYPYKKGGRKNVARRVARNASGCREFLVGGYRGKEKLNSTDQNSADFYCASGRGPVMPTRTCIAKRETLSGSPARQVQRDCSAKGKTE